MASVIMQQASPPPNQDTKTHVHTEKHSPSGENLKNLFKDAIVSCRELQRKHSNK